MFGGKAMISGDKADALFQKSITNNDSKSPSEVPQTSISTFQQRITSCVPSNKDGDPISSTSSEHHSTKEDIVKYLAIETIEAHEKIQDVEINIKELIEKLNVIRSQNRNLEKSIELKLKKNSSVTEYCNIFDKYVNHASVILDKIFRAFHDKLKKTKEKRPVSQSSTDSQSHGPSNGAIASFLSFLNISNVHDLVEGMSAIGHGGEGRVYRATMISTGTPVVVKSYFMDCEQSSRIEYAMLVLCQNVRGVKKPIGLFQTSANYYLVMEDDHKSVPLDVLAEKGILTEGQVQHLFSQMVYILYDLRNKFVKHRDVKLDNFLLNTDNGRLSIIDFGWAMYTAIDQVMVDEVKRSGETLMGTFDYLPPEADSPSGTVVSYEKATVYALGCILLELFFGYQGKVRNILSKESLQSFIARMSLIKYRQVSKGAISILERCLRSSIQERLNLDEVILHPWVLSDKIENSLFNSINRGNILNQGVNISLPSHLNRHLTSSSQ